MCDLYENISFLRERVGIKNDTELCKQADVPRAVLTELKSKRTRQVSRQNAEKFCSVLKVSLDEFYGVQKTEKPSAESRELTDTKRKAIDLIMSIEDDAVLEIFIAAMEKAIKK